MKILKISGMSCNHCVMAVTKALNSIDDIKSVTVNLEKGEVSFEEEKPVDLAVIKEKIEAAGFEVIS